MKKFIVILNLKKILKKASVKSSQTAKTLNAVADSHGIFI